MLSLCIFFFNDTATTEIYTLSLHDALPIFEPSSATTCSSRTTASISTFRCCAGSRPDGKAWTPWCSTTRSEEHTSELQSRLHLVCRLLLEKNKEPVAMADPLRGSNVDRLSR